MFKKLNIGLLIAILPLCVAAQDKMCTWESKTGKVTVNYAEFYELMYESYEAYSAPQKAKHLKSLAMNNAKLYMKTCVDFGKRLKRGEEPKIKSVEPGYKGKGKAKGLREGKRNTRGFIRWVRQDFK